MWAKVCVRCTTVLILLALSTGCPSGSGSDSGTVQGPSSLKAPTEIQCTSVGSDIFLSWKNQEAYDSISVNCNGVETAVLPGTAESYTWSAERSGNYAFQLKASKGRSFSNSESCSVEVNYVPDVEDLHCSFSEISGTVELSWSLPEAGSVEAVKVLRNGVTLALLTPNERTYLDNAPLTGRITYEVKAVRGSLVSGGISCEVNVSGVQGVTNLAGMVDSETGDIFLSWQNEDSYD